MVDYANITFVREGAVARLTLNRPQRRNALTHAMMLELEDAFARLRDELVNRRQLLTFVRSFEEEIIRLHTRCEQVSVQFDGQVEVLRGMVGSQQSVEKEKVYVTDP